MWIACDGTVRDSHLINSFSPLATPEQSGYSMRLAKLTFFGVADVCAIPFAQRHLRERSFAQKDVCAKYICAQGQLRREDRVPNSD